MMSQSDVKTERMGCEHYARKCLFVAPCCKKFYKCRVCHDEHETHEMDRKAVIHIKCAMCDLVQSVRNTCEGCNVVFGKYFCEMCRLYDDEDKGQFHCEGCGLCRIGGRSNFFHCDKCGICLSNSLKGKHKCIEESSRRNCAVCLEDLHTSRSDAHIPRCGHLIHRTCMEQCAQTGNYYCPTCAESLFDMKNAWRILDQEVANTPMPDEYKDYHVAILCRDCHQEDKVLFHVIGLKCPKCGSYNTCRSGERYEANNVTQQIQRQMSNDIQGQLSGGTLGQGSGVAQGQRSGGAEGQRSHWVQGPEGWELESQGSLAVLSEGTVSTSSNYDEES